MLSTKTFFKMDGLSKAIEEENEIDERMTSKESNYLNLILEMAANYSLVKVYESDSKNWHFEVQKVK